MSVVDSRVELERGRDAYSRRAWADAYEALSRVDAAATLDVDDLQLLATSAEMTGRVDEYQSLLERLHRAHLAGGEGLRAARDAFWLGMTLATRGEIGPAGGWFARAQRLVEREERDCVERGYLLMPTAFQRQMMGDYDAAYKAGQAAAEIGLRFEEADLVTVAVHTQGLVRIKQGQIAEGLSLLDEAMAAVTAGEVSPFLTGVVYCGVISGCEEAFEARRAREWTTALARWCEEQPQMVAFSGRCMAHRAGIMRLHGRWQEALEEASRAQDRSEQAANLAAAGQAAYQRGEVHRLQGDLVAAEQAYREANGLGREPQPGLALLRLAQRDVDAAVAAVRRVVEITAEPLQRAVLLPAYVEIMLASWETDEARRASQELAEIAVQSESAMLRAIAAYVTAAVDLAEGDARAALVSLREARLGWQELDAPYEVARVRVLVGLACRALDDEDSATLELEAARGVFGELGAVPDVERVDGLTRASTEDTHGLTARELEVLRLIATGKTNRDIASGLVVSEHTVARHVQNIFRKLEVSSRSAATAFAFEHDLV